MDKDTLNEAIKACKEETKTALQTFYDALPQGQQKQIIKNEKVKEKCDFYGIEY